MTNRPSFEVFVFIFYGEVMTDCKQLNKAVQSNVCLHLILVSCILVDSHPSCVNP